MIKPSNIYVEKFVDRLREAGVSADIGVNKKAFNAQKGKFQLEIEIANSRCFGYDLSRSLQSTTDIGPSILWDPLKDIVQIDLEALDNIAYSPQLKYLEYAILDMQEKAKSYDPLEIASQLTSIFNVDIAPPIRNFTPEHSNLDFHINKKFSRNAAADFAKKVNDSLESLGVSEIKAYGELALGTGGREAFVNLDFDQLSHKDVLASLADKSINLSSDFEKAQAEPVVSAEQVIEKEKSTPLQRAKNFFKLGR